MSVDTNVKGKDLSPYRTLRHGGSRILVAPALVGLCDSLRVVVGGRLTKRLRVELTAPGGVDGCCR